MSKASVDGSHCDYGKEEKEIVVGGISASRRKERGLRRRRKEGEETIKGIENKGEIFYLLRQGILSYLKSII